MATRTLKATGGNWNSTGTWNEGVVPIAGDTVTCSGGGNLTVTAAAACASLDFTGFSNTFTINSGVSLSMTSTLKFVAGMSLVAGNSASTISLVAGGATTITSGGLTIPFQCTFGGSQTFTLGDAWTVSGKLNLGSGSTTPVFNGNSFTTNGDFAVNTTGNISGTANIVIGAACTITGTGTVNNNFEIKAGIFSVTFPASFKYGTGTFKYTSGVVNFNTNSTNFQIESSCTIQGGASCTFVIFTIAVAATITLGADLYASVIDLPNANATFAGAFNVIGGSLTQSSVTVARTHTLVAGQTYSFTMGIFGNTASLPFAGTAAANINLQSSSSGNAAFLTVAGGSVTGPPAVFAIYTNATDIDSSGGQPIIAPDATLTRTVNWQNGLTFPVRVWPTLNLPTAGGAYV